MSKSLVISHPTSDLKSQRFESRRFQLRFLPSFHSSEAILVAIFWRSAISNRCDFKSLRFRLAIWASKHQIDKHHIAKAIALLLFQECLPGNRSPHQRPQQEYPDRVMSIASSLVLSVGHANCGSYCVLWCLPLHSDKRWALAISMERALSQKVQGGEPQGVRKHFLSSKVSLCFKKVLGRKKASRQPPGNL